MKKTIYVDMDNCMCDYTASYLRYKEQFPQVEYPQSIPGLFLGLEPIQGALETVKWLASQELFDVYILSTPSVMNPHSYSEKRQWVEKHLGMDFVRKLILSAHKHLNKGDFLVDDRAQGQGQDMFEGELVQYGADPFPDWASVKNYFEQVLSQPESNNFDDLKEQILCFRAFDLRNRFEEPFTTFRGALEALQSERAYLPEESGEIVCYLKDGKRITVPEHFYIEQKPRFDSREQAESWLKDRNKNVKDGGIGAILGIAVANPNDPFEKQVSDALGFFDCNIVDSSKNQELCFAVEKWLSSAIKALA